MRCVLLKKKATERALIGGLSLMRATLRKHGNPPNRQPRWSHSPLLLCLRTKSPCRKTISLALCLPQHIVGH